ncbi:MAG: hypothetical protein GYB31_07170 [Bacteroidetes bacterium]|nr:hypothetical protein [Bacteroidota bacterium]
MTRFFSSKTRQSIKVVMISALLIGISVGIIYVAQNGIGNMPGGKRAVIYTGLLFAYSGFLISFLQVMKNGGNDLTIDKPETYVARGLLMLPVIGLMAMVCWTYVIDSTSLFLISRLFLGAIALLLSAVGIAVIYQILKRLFKKPPQN